MRPIVITWLAVFALGSVLLPGCSTPPAPSTPTVPAVGAPPTGAAPPTPGLTVRGHVRLRSPAGPGLAGVKIHLYFASYAPGSVAASTHADGYYETAFRYIPGDEMVTVWPEFTGYTFEPPRYYWRHYYSIENAVHDFVANPTPK